MALSYVLLCSEIQNSSVRHIITFIQTFQSSIAITL